MTSEQLLTNELNTFGDSQHAKLRITQNIAFELLFI